MTLCQSLQGSQRRGHNQEIGIGHMFCTCLTELQDTFGLHHKVADTSAIEVFNILMTVVTGRLQGKEQGLLRETKGAAVGEQPTDLGIGYTNTTRPNECCDLFDGIFHFSLLYLFYTAKLGYFFCNAATFNIVLSINA